MAIQKIDAYAARCDSCKDDYDNGTFSIFVSESDLNDEIGCSDWHVDDDGKVYCPVCIPDHIKESDDY